MHPRFRFSELATWLVMLAGLGWLSGWAYVGAAAHEPARGASPQICPSADECWGVCFRASVMALDSCFEHFDATCISEQYRDCEATLQESDDRYWALQTDYQDHCDVVIQSLTHEMYFEDRSFDEWEDSATEGGTDADTTGTVP